MPGAAVFINIGFLGEGTVMTSDITSFNIYVCVFVYPRVCTYLVLTPALYIT